MSQTCLASGVLIVLGLAAWGPSGCAPMNQTDRLAGDRDSLEQQLRLTRRQLRSQQAELARLQKRYEGLSARQREAARQLRAAQQAQALVEKRLADQAAPIQSAAKQIDEQTRRLALLTKELDKTLSRCKALQEAMRQREAQIALLEQHRRSLERQLVEAGEQARRATTLPATQPTSQPHPGG